MVAPYSLNYARNPDGGDYPVCPVGLIGYWCWCRCTTTRWLWTALDLATIVGFGILAGAVQGVVEPRVTRHGHGVGAGPVGTTANPSAEPEDWLALAASTPVAISATLAIDTVVITAVVITTVVTATTNPLWVSRTPRASPTRLPASALRSMVRNGSATGVTRSSHETAGHHAGAYWQIGYTRRMKSRTEYVRQECVTELRRQAVTHKRFKRLVDQ